MTAMAKRKVLIGLGDSIGGRQRAGRSRVVPDMSAFATLAAVYSMPPACDVHARLKASTPTDRARRLNEFLASVELRAFRIARAALRHEEDALDAVQDAMLQLARAYGGRPPAEWTPLFYRILGNRVRDLYRRRAVRARLFAWLPSHRDENDEESAEPLAQAESLEPQPPRRVEAEQALIALDAALRTLPHRQREAFLLRTLEGLDVAQTAAAMGCSEGSVKTHYFRALRALRLQLGEFVP
jgi:RNA polymerase sigma-70 factor, ECF subfamily